MRQVFLVFLILGIASSCGENPPIENNKKAAVKSPEASISEEEIIPDSSLAEYPILNSETAPEYLSNYFKENPERKIVLKTKFGNIKIRLYEKTPLHSASFLMLVNRDYFNNTEFTRVVKNFIIQGGNNENEQKELERLLIGTYRLKPELVDEYFHKKGAVAIARRYKNNPDKLSSPYNFYIVHGRTFNEPQLMAMERDNEIEIPTWKREIYSTIGGAPHLDGEHTVFGEVYEGMDVVDKLANIPTDNSEWPLQTLQMSIEVINE